MRTKSPNPPSTTLRRFAIFLIVVCGFDSPSVFAETRADEPRPIRIAVYEGEGAGRSCVDLLTVLDQGERASRYAVSRITAEAIQTGGLNEVDVLVQPGGSGGKQGRALAESGRQAVREFVGNGGGFIGICAGAYLATNDYTWSLGLIDAKVVDRKHWARGNGPVTIELSPEARRFFEIEDHKVSIYYGQGPLLNRREWDDPLVPDYESLAIYRTGIARNGAPEGVMPGTSAIVRTEFGDGRVFVFSAHPEKTDGLRFLVGKAVEWVSQP